MPDRYQDFAAGLDMPAIDGFAITPSDTMALPEVTRALYIGSAGMLAVKLASGREVNFAGLAAGTLLPVRVRQVMASGTSADALVGLV